MKIFKVASAAGLLCVLAACGPVSYKTSPAQTGSPVPVPPAVTATMPASAPTVTDTPRAQGTTAAASGLQPVHDPGQVTGTIAGPCHMTGAYPDQRPDSRCTPGSYDPAVTQANIHQTICVSGYTATVRPPESQTGKLKFDDAYPAYGVDKNVKTELDHLVPLELGGSNSSLNLWPEPEKSIPNAKDGIEGDLHRAVCSGKVTLTAAQNAIAANWTTAERVLGLAGG